MKIQLVASFLLLLPQLARCMDTQPHFFGTPEQIWKQVVDEFEEQNNLQGFHNPKQLQVGGNKITFESTLGESIWQLIPLGNFENILQYPHENFQNMKTDLKFGVHPLFVDEFKGKALEYKQLYTFSDYLPKEPVSGLEVKTAGIIKATTYCEVNKKEYKSYHLMQWYMSYDTSNWELNTYRNVKMDEVLATVGWKEIKSEEIVFLEKESFLNFITDPMIYKFNEHKKLEIQPKDDENLIHNAPDFFKDAPFTTAENYFNLPVDIGKKIVKWVVSKENLPTKCQIIMGVVVCVGAILLKKKL